MKKITRGPNPGIIAGLNAQSRGDVYLKAVTGEEGCQEEPTQELMLSSGYDEFVVACYKQNIRDTPYQVCVSMQLAIADIDQPFHQRKQEQLRPKSL